MAGRVDSKPAALSAGDEGCDTISRSSAGGSHRSPAGTRRRRSEERIATSQWATNSSSTRLTGTTPRSRSLRMCCRSMRSLGMTGVRLSRSALGPSGGCPERPCSRSLRWGASGERRLRRQVDERLWRAGDTNVGESLRTLVLPDLAETIGDRLVPAGVVAVEEFLGDARKLGRLLPDLLRAPAHCARDLDFANDHADWGSGEDHDAIDRMPATNLPELELLRPSQDVLHMLRVDRQQELQRPHHPVSECLSL